MASTVAKHKDNANIETPQNETTDSVDGDQITSSDKLVPGTELSSGPSQVKGSISSSPAAGQLISHNGKDYDTVKEGLAYILVPPSIQTAIKKDDDSKSEPKKKRVKGEKNEEHMTNQSVFYNEIMQYNRDLSVLAIRAYGEDWVERQKVKAEKKERYVRKGREKAEAKRAKREGHAKIKAQLGDGNQVTVESSSQGAADNDTKALPDAVAPSTRAKRSREPDESASAEASARAKRNKIDPDTETANSEGAVPFDKAGHSSGVTVDTTALDESWLLDEDLISVEQRVNGANGFDGSADSPHRPHFKILDALSATGLRALRYAHELPFVTSVVANDLSQKATDTIALNVDHNKLGDKITAVTGNANAHMYSFAGQEHKGGPGKLYDVIDLDPYGTAVPFLDSAVQALSDGGLLCVTCTDTAVFMSNSYPEKAFSLYGGTTVKGQCAHEGGLRLMLHSIATTAARHGIAIEPLLTLSIDYYARVFVRLKRSPADVKFLMAKTMTLAHCDNGCHAITPQWLGRNTATENSKGQQIWKFGYAQQNASGSCEHCGFKTHVNGPMWGGPLHNPSFIERILGFLPSIDKSTYPTCERLEGMLTTALEEMETFSLKEKKATDNEGPGQAVDGTVSALIDPVASEVRDLHPFYIFPSSLAKVLHCLAPSEVQIRGALRHAGFRAERTHAARGGIKTDASYSAIWHVMREWVRQKAPIKDGSLKESMAGWKILYGTKTGPQVAHAAITKEDGHVGATVQQNGDETVHGRPDLDALGGKEGPGAMPHSFPVVFDEELGKDRGKKVKRFQLNPRANWGPMARAK